MLTGGSFDYFLMMLWMFALSTFAVLIALLLCSCCIYACIEPPRDKRRSKPKLVRRQQTSPPAPAAPQQVIVQRSLVVTSSSRGQNRLPPPIIQLPRNPARTQTARSMVLPLPAQRLPGIAEENEPGRSRRGGGTPKCHVKERQYPEPNGSKPVSSLVTVNLNTGPSEGNEDERIREKQHQQSRSKTKSSSKSERAHSHSPKRCKHDAVTAKSEHHHHTHSPHPHRCNHCERSNWHDKRSDNGTRFIDGSGSDRWQSDMASCSCRRSKCGGKCGRSAEW